MFSLGATGYDVIDWFNPNITSTGGSASGLGTAGTIAGIGGAISSGIGSFFQAKSLKSSLKYQSQMSAINARIDELGAQQELFKGQSEIAKLTMAAGNLKSSQRTAMAANGIDLGVGNAAEIQASTDIMREIDKNTIQSNALRSAWGYRMQGANATSQSLVQAASAKGISPLSAGMTSLMTNAGSVADKWYQNRMLSSLTGSSGAIGSY